MAVNQFLGLFLHVQTEHSDLGYETGLDYIINSKSIKMNLHQKYTQLNGNDKCIKMKRIASTTIHHI